MIILKEASNKLYHLSFRNKNKTIEKNGFIKKGSYVTDSLDYIKAFDFLNGYNNSCYQLTENPEVKLDNDWENFKKDYKSGILITDEFIQYVYWIGYLYTNKINPFKNKLLIIKENSKVKKIDFNNNLKNIHKLNQPNLFWYDGLIALYKEYGEKFTKEKHNGILIDIDNYLCAIQIIKYPSYYSAILRSDKKVDFFFHNKHIKANSKFEVIDKIQKKYKCYFV